MSAKIAFMLVLAFSMSAFAAGDVKLGEKLPPGANVAVEVAVSLDGDMILPAKAGAKPQRLAVVGSSKLAYDERSLTSDEPGTDRLLRFYRQIEIERTVGDRKQTADIRKDVRRMVVLRNAKAKSPFSPDGPLTWNEIDVVKNDLFAPVLAAGLLPNKAVKPGDFWVANAAAIRELTDLEKVSEGELKITFTGVVQFDNRERARLSVSGSLRGVDDNGPARHTIDGTAYVDLDTSLLAYLSVKGTHELLDGDGRTLGRIDGRFTLTRKLAVVDALSDAAIAKLELKPTAENSRLLYENAELGVKFAHSRRWRVGAVQGRQITLDGPNGAGLLLTVESAKTLPTVDAFLKETTDFIAKEKGSTANLMKPSRLQEKPHAVDRFGFDANLGKDKLRMEYGVVTSAAGGATLAARLPRDDARDLDDDIAQLLKDLRLTK